jgi:hypothetical protein
MNQVVHNFPSAAQRELGEAIAVLAGASQHCPLEQLVRTVDAIRSAANREGLGQVAMLAGQLETAIGTRGRSAVILTYLDAMSAALGQPADIDSSAADDAWAALVAVRFAN